jgi:hypothetical protein
VADVFRAPFFSGRREIAPALEVRAFTVSSLLLTTLAAVVVALPPGAQACDSSPQRAIFQPANESRGIPKTLFADAQAPVGVAWSASAAPEPRRDVTDTSRSVAETLLPVPIPAGTNPAWITPQHWTFTPADATKGIAKTLFADAQLPVGSKWTATAPEPKRDVTDTSRALSTPLLPIPPTPVPAGVNSPWVTPQEWTFTPADSSKGSAKTLIADAQAPVGARWTVNAPEPVRSVTDTSRSPATPLLPVAAIPIPAGVNSPWITPQRWTFTPADSTKSAAKTLFSDAQAPVGQDWTASAPEPNRSVTDTSRALSTPLLPVAAVPVPAGTNSPWVTPQRWTFTPADSSKGRAKVLFSDAQLPVGARWTANAPEPNRIGTETSRGLTTPFLPFIAGAMSGSATLVFSGQGVLSATGLWVDVAPSGGLWTPVSANVTVWEDV